MNLTCYSGVESVNIDRDKGLLIVKGTMELKPLLQYLNKKLKRNVVQVVPPKKNNHKKEKDGRHKKPEKEKPLVTAKKHDGLVPTVLKLYIHGPVPTVLKLGIHCQECAAIIKHTVSLLDGTEDSNQQFPSI